jgi:hypothetical protein
MAMFRMKLTCLCLLLVGTMSVAKAAPTKVLYFTHEPGRWHKYTPQMKIFKELGQKAGWQVTFDTGTYDGQIKKLAASDDYAKDYDAIVYNFCFAGSKDIEAAGNLMKQTREHGVPALLIHCAMHSWWPTYKNGKTGAIGGDYKGKAKADPKLVAQWKKDHPGKTFPAWGDFTGVASHRHGPKKPIKLTAVPKNKKHPALRRFPAAGFSTGNTELYNNAYVLDAVVPLIMGKQGNSKDTIVVWTCPQGKSQVMGLSTGHDVNDWKAEPFLNLIEDGINYLAKNPKP